jgi:hypothetical protein
MGECGQERVNLGGPPPSNETILLAGCFRLPIPNSVSAGNFIELVGYLETSWIHVFTEES